MIVAQSDSVVFRLTAESDLDFVAALELEAAAERFVNVWARSSHVVALSAESVRHLIVECAQTGERVGFILLAGVGAANNCIEFRRIVIGPKGRGFGRKAVELLKTYVFDDLGAHRLWLDVKEFNHRARKLYASAGFVEEGTLRECVRAETGYESLVVMALLEAEFRAARSE